MRIINLDDSVIKGLVIGAIPYNESSRIVKLFTKDKGMIPLWVRTGKKIKKAIWHPLSAVELSGYKRKKKDGLATFKEASRVLPANNILKDARRSAVAFFIAEVVDKSISDEAPLPEVFNLLWDTINLLESSDSVANLHIFFVGNLVNELGLMPEIWGNEREITSGSLNLSTGEWSEVEMNLSKEAYFLKSELAFLMMKIPGMKFDDMQSLGLDKSSRKELLLGMVMFIQLNHAGLREIKSYDVLETIFSA
ncbi:MAG: DNA repair protein RecO [Bacteroidetes bacterium]|nr:MAG: DNA repair protein RecO [Bacteroidota bacterium]